MSKIRVLKSAVIDRIAAGEVVERPASVVKELVENALDAGATRIHVSLTGGGLGEIRVLDDGRGMDAEDARTAVLRHATSKITSDADLERVETLGFRGEALPSIASVSDFRLETGVGLSAPGTGLEMGPNGPVLHDAPPRKGTLVVVRDLFGAVPARRKFLKTARTEVARCQSVLLRTALARPDVGFVLDHGGRKLLDAAPAGDLQERARQVLGRRDAARFFEARSAGSAAGSPASTSVHALLAPPDAAASSAERLHVILNGRPIRDRSVAAAVRQGYGPLLARGRTPPGLVLLTLDPAQVDVNVHPAKAEVRFADPGEVYRAVLRAVRGAVATTPWMNAGAGSTAARPPGSAVAPGVEAESLPPRSLPGPDSPRPWRGATVPGGQRAFELPALKPAGPAAGIPLAEQWKKEPAATERGSQPNDHAAAASFEGSYSKLRYLGQIARLFLVCDDGARLVLIDQHAAHERILFDEIRGAARAQGLAMQPLLFPDVFQASPQEVALAEAHRETLRRYGLDVEPAGPESLALRGVPGLLRRADFPKLVLQVVADLEEGSASPTAEQRLDLVHATMACHAAVRAGDVLSKDEVRAILVAMDRTDLRAYCPHGRPAVAHMDHDAVARLFDRR